MIDALVSPQALSVNQANLQSVAIGQLGLGPISVGNLVLNNIDFSMSAAQGVLQDMSVTVTLHISVERHVHVGLPDGIPDFDIGDTCDLGSFGFSLPVGNVVVPGLSNLHFHIPGLTARNLAVSAGPVSPQLTSVIAERVHAADVTLPIDALNLTLSQIGIDAVQIPSFTVA